MKKKAKLFFYSALLLLSISACKHDGFTIEGTIEGGAGRSLWLEEIAPEGPIFIDSIPMDADGHFKYHYNPRRTTTSSPSRRTAKPLR